MFKDNLRSLRESRGLYQKNLADMLGIKANSYSQYESGKNEPSIQTLIKLADYFDVSLDYLLGRDTTPVETNNDLDTLMCLARQLNQDDQRKLCKIAKVFTEQNTD